VYTGREDDLSQEGEAIALNAVLAQARKDTGKQVQHTPSRVMSIRFALDVDAYTPTFRAESAIKDEFYDSVRKEIEKANSNDTIICLGDWNARVGTRDDEWQETLWPYGNPERNDNGLRLLELCAARNFKVMGTTADTERGTL